MSTSEPWVDGLTYRQVLERTVERYGDRDAVVFPRLGVRWSYEEFYRRARETARALIALGVKPGEHVGIWATNWPEWVLAQFATGVMGAVLVNVNPAYRTHELAYILKQADIKVLLIMDAHKTSDYEAMVVQLIPLLEKALSEPALEAPEYPHLRHVVSIKESVKHPGILSWPELIKMAGQVTEPELDACAEKTSPDSPVNIQFTSGTTGDPKGATLAHRNLLMNAYYTGDRQGFSEHDRVCIPVPLYHCFGCVIGTLSAAVYGAAMVFPAESFEPEATLQTVQEEQCTALYGVPTMFSAEVHSPAFDAADLSSLWTGVMAGSPCPIELMKTVMTKMHMPEITIAYGQTEASPVITMSRTSDPIEVRVGTVGSPLPGVEVRIIDPETGKDVKAGEQGELIARGHCVMLGYYQMPEATAAAIDEDGWLHTGDLATATPDGNYRITGRIKDMIIRGGENVYPREIEDFLLEHPKIREAQVVGLPDQKFGEQVSAWIVPEDASLTEDDVIAYCRERIAHYKVPKYVVLLDEFPLTVTGKVQKFKLRDDGIERFDLHEAARVETA